MDATDHIGGVKESLRVSRHPHEQAHHRDRRPVYHSDDGGPNQKVPGEELHGPGKEDEPRPGREHRPPGAAAPLGDGGVEEAGDDAGVSADVLEDGDGVEGGLGVGLGGLEGGGVDAEGVRCAAAGLDPYARDGRHPFVVHPPRHVGRSLGVRVSVDPR